MSPALNPAGSCQSSLVGSPESPGLRQYVCQPSRMSSSNATQNVWPGPTEATSLTRRALTLSVLTVLPVSAKAAGDANSRANSQNLSARMGLCYRITAPHERRVLKGCGPSHSLKRQYRCVAASAIVPPDASQPRKLRRSNTQGKSL